jgi:hypothetical protein
MSMPSHLAQPQQQQHTPQMAHTPLNNHDDNLPPWLWPTNGSPDILRMPNSGPEDVDVNMDEGFDWQSLQESMGWYDVEAYGGRGGSTWGPGL